MPLSNTPLATPQIGDAHAINALGLEPAVRSHAVRSVHDKTLEDPKNLKSDFSKALASIKAKMDKSKIEDTSFLPPLSKQARPMSDILDSFRELQITKNPATQNPEWTEASGKSLKDVFGSPTPDHQKIVQEIWQKIGHRPGPAMRQQWQAPGTMQRPRPPMAPQPPGQQPPHMQQPSEQAPQYQMWPMQGQGNGPMQQMQQGMQPMGGGFQQSANGQYDMQQNYGQHYPPQMGMYNQQQQQENGYSGQGWNQYYQGHAGQGNFDNGQGGYGGPMGYAMAPYPQHGADQQSGYMQQGWYGQS